MPCNVALLLQIPYSFMKKYIPEIDKIIFDVVMHPTDNVIQNDVIHIKEILCKMYNILELQPDGIKLYFQSLLFKLLYLLYHNFRVEVSENYLNKQFKNLTRLEPIIEYTKQNHHKSITIEEISQVAHLQPKYFCRFFKKHMGRTYLEYLNAIRLAHIYQDLLLTDYTISQLLDLHGVTNYKLFRRIFYEYFHDTPKNIRKNYKEDLSAVYKFLGI
jgi:AraC-like DNA-binding protein